MAQQKIVPNLWFDSEAEEAAAYYIDVFGSGQVLSVARYPEGAPGPTGSVMTVEFEVAGMRFVGINGGPQFPFTEAVSFQVDCADQAEVDRLWDALSADGGAPERCGWIKDRYGVPWQIVPAVLPRMLADPDPAKAERVMRVMLGMAKLDIAALRAAHDGGAPAAA